MLTTVTNTQPVSLVRLPTRPALNVRRALDVVRVERAIMRVQHGHGRSVVFGHSARRPGLPHEWWSISRHLADLIDHSAPPPVVF